MPAPITSRGKPVFRRGSVRSPGSTTARCSSSQENASKRANGRPSGRRTVMDSLVNPFGEPAAIANSHYSEFHEGGVIDPDPGDRRPALTRFVHDSLRSLVLNEQFPCLGGKSAVRQGAYRFGLYGELGSTGAAAGLARDLF